jgi:hypothetical protein
MRKYLQTVFDRLSALKNGINLNAPLWAGQPDTPATVQAEMDALVTINDEIEQLEDARQQKIAEARALAAAKNEVAGQIEKRAVAIHVTDPGKLNEYDIKAGPAPGEKRPVPGKAIIASIGDDDDGIGFKLRILKLEHTDHFEVERGVATGGTRLGDSTTVPPSTPTPTTEVTVLQPPYPFLRTTSKLTFVDDDVQPGTRYFYRVRGVNTTGPGAWSEPVSAIQ